jgi:uncharacterized protein with beta-barrel porin domain
MSAATRIWGGTLQLTNLGYKPKAGDQLTLVTTGGSVTTRFARWVNPFNTAPGINTIDLVYGRNSVVLKFLNILPPAPPVITTIDFASFAQTPNQFAAANLLDAVQLDSRASNLMSFLHKEPFGNLGSDFDKISPESLTAFYEISFSGANIQRLNLENRLEDIDSEESLRSDVGFRASYQWQAGSVHIEPFLKATLEHEFKYSALPITAGFADIDRESHCRFCQIGVDSLSRRVA